MKRAYTVQVEQDWGMQLHCNVREISGGGGISIMVRPDQIPPAVLWDIRHQKQYDRYTIQTEDTVQKVDKWEWLMDGQPQSSNSCEACEVCEEPSESFDFEESSFFHTPLTTPEVRKGDNLHISFDRSEYREVDKIEVTGFVTLHLKNGGTLQSDNEQTITVLTDKDAGFQSVQFPEFSTLQKEGSATSENYEEVNHPGHYNWHPIAECIDIIEWFESVNVAFAVKHLWRAGHKPSTDVLTDLRKAAWYINREIQRLDGFAEDEHI